MAKRSELRGDLSLLYLNDSLDDMEQLRQKDENGDQFALEVAFLQSMHMWDENSMGVESPLDPWVQVAIAKRFREDLRSNSGKRYLAKLFHEVEQKLLPLNRSNALQWFLDRNCKSTDAKRLAAIAMEESPSTIKGAPAELAAVISAGSDNVPEHARLGNL